MGISTLISQSIAKYKSLPIEIKQKLDRQQRINWVYGNVVLSNPDITREMVEQIAKDKEI